MSEATSPTDPTEQSFRANNSPASRPSLDIEHILIPYFEYARSSAAQMNSERNRLFDQYLLIVGAGFVATVGIVTQLNQIGAREYILPTILLILFVGALVGSVYFVTLILSRLAQRDALIELSVILEFYIRETQRQYPEVRVNNLFRWRLSTIPSSERIGSVTWLMSASIGSIASSLFAASTLLILQSAGVLLPIPLSGAVQFSIGFAVALMIFGSFFIQYYRRRFNKRRTRRHLQTVEERISIT